MKTEKRLVGKGLGALLRDELSDSGNEREADIKELPLSEIEPNPNQPRKIFDEEELKSLADSIKAHGIIQPILVSEKRNNVHIIIAGERRWRAAHKAGLKTIPTIIRQYDGEQTFEISLIENLQRANLNPVEEAEGYHRLISSFGLTQEQISEKVGKSRPAVANALRLLSLPEEIKVLLLSGELSSGHARTLLSVSDDGRKIELAKKVLRDKLSVRELEKIVTEKVPAKENKIRIPRRYDEEYRTIEDRLCKRFGTRVRVSGGNRKGKIEIEYSGNEDFNRILDILEKR